MKLSPREKKLAVAASRLGRAAMLLYDCSQYAHDGRRRDMASALRSLEQKLDHWRDAAEAYAKEIAALRAELDAGTKSGRQT